MLLCQQHKRLASLGNFLSLKPNQRRGPTFITYLAAFNLSLLCKKQKKTVSKAEKQVGPGYMTRVFGSDKEILITVMIKRGDRT